MRTDELRKVAVMVAGLAETFNRQVSEATLEAYRIGLDDLPFEAVSLAFKRALQTCKFMPSPAEIRELSGVAQGKDRAVMAWDAVLKAIPYGSYKHVNFGDAAINATIRSMGGWPTFVSRFASAEDEKWLRKDFVDAYTAIAKHFVSGEAGAPLPGLAEAQVVDGVLTSPVPLLIECGYEVISVGYEEQRAPRLAKETPALTLRKP